MGAIYLFREYDTIKDMKIALSKCTYCVYGLHSKKVGGIGSPTASLMVVGQNPGPKEVGTGIPFSSVSGALLKDIISKVGIPMENCYLTNVIKCKPIVEEKIATVPVKCCKPWLDIEVDIVAPRLIVALGQVASDAVLGTNSPVGKVLQSRFGIPGIGTYHTAYIQRLKNSGTSDYALNKYRTIKKEVYEHWKLVASIIGVESVLEEGDDSE